MKIGSSRTLRLVMLTLAVVAGLAYGGYRLLTGERRLVQLVESGLGDALGADVSVEEARYEAFGPLVAKGVTVRHSSGRFKGEVFLRVPVIEIEHRFHKVLDSDMILKAVRLKRGATIEVRRDAEGAWSLPEVIESLRELGPRARGALPALKELADRDSPDGWLARRAIAEIEGG